MKQTEYQDRITELVFQYLAAPLVILIGTAVIGKALDTILGTEQIFSIIFPIGGLVIYVIPMIFRKNLIEEYVDPVKNILSKKSRRPSDDYIYLDKEKISIYYSDYFNQPGIMTGEQRANSTSGTLGISGTSIGTSSSINTNYEVLSERLFESVEEKLRKDFRKINALEEVEDSKPVWVSAELSVIGQGMDSLMNEKKDMVLMRIFEEKRIAMSFNKNFFKSEYRNFFERNVKPEIPVEMLCKIIKQGKGYVVTPIVIFKE